MKKSIPLSIPNFIGNEKKYVESAVEQGWVSTGGSYVIEMEKSLEDYLNVEAVAVCQSGTSALHLSLIETQIGPGDAVICSPLTFIAAINPIRYCSAEPIFIDCDDSLCLDPVKLREFCKNECRFEDDRLIYDSHHVKAIIVVHVFGNMADMESIMDVANDYNLRVIEDATEALGTRYISGRYEGMFAGTIGDFGAYSFNGNKIITTGGGGAVTSGNVHAVNHMRYLSTQAKDDPSFYVHNEIGYNYRMTNVQAAIGVAQMEQLPGFVNKKQHIYMMYKELFANYPYAKLFEYRKNTEPNYWLCAIEMKNDSAGVDIKKLMHDLKNDGIETRMIWELIHEQKPYQGSICYKIEQAKYYSNVILNIPSSSTMDEEEVLYVADRIKNAINRQI